MMPSKVYPSLSVYSKVTSLPPGTYTGFSESTVIPSVSASRILIMSGSLPVCRRSIPTAFDTL